ncbi:MAG: adenylate/guanylate cyclase domain-containing protein [Hyphomicrobiaceae bacterium]
MSVLFSGTVLQRLRLLTGLVLFAFVLTHFLNHALALYSIDLAERVEDWRVAITRSLPGSILLIAAVLLHPPLGILRFLKRGTLRMPPWEALQIASGLAIPVLLIPHIVGSRIAHILFGVHDDYFYMLAGLWPHFALDQGLLLLVVWAHGCMGLHFWLRLTAWYRRVFPIALTLASMIPVVALAGFASGGREVHDLISDHEELATLMQESKWPNQQQTGVLLDAVEDLRMAYLGIIGLAVGIVAFRIGHGLVRRRVSIRYLGGPIVQAPVGPTLLEISRLRRVPHMSVCGGRARCSTCRVRVVEGLDTLDPPSPSESRTLKRIHATDDVRLACQLRPHGDLVVQRLVRPGDVRVLPAVEGGTEAHGIERLIAVMFLDIRGFTRLSQSKLPYDVVLVLNRLFAHVVAAIEDEGGTIDKYLGDGLMAIFVRDADPAVCCRNALRAARALGPALDRANEELQAELGEPIRIGVGLHAGPVVLGEIGHRDSAHLTVIGRTVNAAARLEQATKDEDCQIIVSDALMRIAGTDPGGLPRKSIQVRGLDEPLDVLLVRKFTDLPAVPAGAARQGSSVHAHEVSRRFDRRRR